MHLSKVACCRVTSACDLLHSQNCFNAQAIDGFMHVGVVCNVNQASTFCHNAYLSVPLFSHISTFPGPFSVIPYLSTRCPQAFLLPLEILPLPAALQSPHSPHLSFPDRSLYAYLPRSFVPLPDRTLLSSVCCLWPGTCLFWPSAWTFGVFNFLFACLECVSGFWPVECPWPACLPCSFGFACLFGLLSG